MTRPEAVLAIGMETSVGVVTRVDGTAKKPIVAVAGVGSREAAEALRGTPILVDRSVVGLEEGEYWADDLVGLRVVDGERAVGVVDRVRALPSCEVLEVGVTSTGDPNSRGSKGETLLIPLVDDAVRTVDVAAGVIDVNLEFLGAG